MFAPITRCTSILIHSPMLSGDRLRGEERQAPDLVPGELGHHRGRDAQWGHSRSSPHPSRMGRGIITSRSSIAPRTELPSSFWMDACACLLAGLAAAIVGVVRSICFSIWWRMQTGARG
jgi:hypothetical protein